jgi:DNA invertase Pin-like site-specific DNA recombinase
MTEYDARANQTPRRRSHAPGPEPGGKSMAQPEPNKAILYAAKSTEDKHGSIRTQLADTRAMAEREGWEVIGEYADESASAWSGDRGPQLAAAMEHAEREQGVLVVQHTDRLARGDGVKARHLIELYLWAAKAGVSLRSIQDDSTCENLIMAAVMGERNAEDSRRKSLAVKAGMKRRREAGKYHGGPPAYGTTYLDGEQVPVEAEAATVRRMFAELVAGSSQLAITRGLIADSIPTARGGKWHQGTVRQILANALYVELGIIDPDTWAKAEALRESRRRTYATGRPPAGRHLFRKGMLRCECGEALVPRTDSNRSGEPYEVYRCYGRHRDPESCSMPPIPRADVDTAVYRYFEEVGLDFEATKKAISEGRDQRLAQVRALLAAAEKEAAQIDEGRTRVERDYLNGELSAKGYDRMIERLDKEQPAAQAEVERLRIQAKNVAQDGAVLDAESETLHALAGLRRAIAGEIRDADGVAAVRAALSRLFEGFELRHQIISFIPYELGPLCLSPIPKVEMVERDRRGPMTLQRVPLEQAANNYALAFTM